MRKFAKVTVVLACLTLSSAANANPTNGANCVGKAVSALGPVGAGLFQILQWFGGIGIGDVARTHCDPSWD